MPFTHADGAKAQTPLNVPPAILKQEGDELHRLIRESREAANKQQQQQRAQQQYGREYFDQLDDTLPEFNEAGVIRFLDAYQRMDWATALKLPQAPSDKRNLAAWSVWIAQASRQCIEIIDQWSSAVGKPLDEVRQIYDELDRSIVLDLVLGHQGPVRGRIEDVPTVLESMHNFQELVHKLTREIRETETPNPLDAHNNPKAWGVIMSELAEALAEHVMDHDAAIAEGLDKFVMEPAEAMEDECATRLDRVGLEGDLPPLTSERKLDMNVGPRTPADAGGGGEDNTRVFSAWDKSSLGKRQMFEFNFNQSAKAFMEQMISYGIAPAALLRLDLLPNGARNKAGERGFDATFVEIMRLIHADSAIEMAEERSIFARLCSLRHYYMMGETPARFHERVRNFFTSRLAQEVQAREILQRPLERTPRPIYRPVHAPDDMASFQMKSTIGMLCELGSYWWSQDADSVDTANKRSMTTRIGMEIVEKVLSIVAGAGVYHAPLLWRMLCVGNSSLENAQAAEDKLFRSLALLKEQAQNEGPLQTLQESTARASDRIQEISVLRSLLPTANSPAMIEFQQYAQQEREQLQRLKQQQISFGGTSPPPPPPPTLALEGSSHQADAHNLLMSAVNTELVAYGSNDGGAAIVPTSAEETLGNALVFANTDAVSANLDGIAEKSVKLRNFALTRATNADERQQVEEVFVEMNNQIDMNRDFWRMGQAQYHSVYESRFNERMENVERNMKMGEVLAEFQSRMTADALQLASQHIDNILKGGENVGKTWDLIRESVKDVVNILTTESTRNLIASHALIDSMPTSFAGHERAPLQYLKNFLWPFQPLLESHLEPFTVMRLHNAMQLIDRAERSLIAQSDYADGRYALTITVPDRITMTLRHVNTQQVYARLTTEKIALFSPTETASAAVAHSPEDVYSRVAGAMMLEAKKLPDIINNAQTTYGVGVSDLRLEAKVSHVRTTTADLTAQLNKLRGAKAVIVERLTSVLHDPTHSMLAYYTNPNLNPTMDDLMIQNLIMVKLFASVTAMLDSIAWICRKLTGTYRTMSLRESNPVMRVLRQRITILDTVDDVFGTHLSITPFEHELSAFDEFVYDMVGQQGNVAREELRRVFGTGEDVVRQPNYAQVLNYINEHTDARLRRVRFKHTSYWSRWWLVRDTWFVGDAIRAHAGLASMWALYTLVIRASHMYGKPVPLVWGGCAAGALVMCNIGTDYLFQYFVRTTAAFGNVDELGPNAYYRGLLTLVDRCAERSLRPRLFFDVQLERIAQTFGVGDNRALSVLIVGLTMLEPGLAAKLVGAFLAAIFVSTVISMTRSLSYLNSTTALTTSSNVPPSVVGFTNVLRNVGWLSGPVGLAIVFLGSWVEKQISMPAVGSVLSYSGTALRGLGGLFMTQMFTSSLSDSLSNNYLSAFALARTTAVMLFSLGTAGSCWSWVRAQAHRLQRANAFRQRVIVRASQTSGHAADSYEAEQLIQYDLQAEAANRALEARLLSTSGLEVMYKSRRHHVMCLSLQAPVIVILTLMILAFNFNRIAFYMTVSRS